MVDGAIVSSRPSRHFFSSVATTIATGFDSSPDVTDVGFDDSGSDFGGGGDDFV